MGDEDVGDLDPVALGPLEQRAEVVVAVDQHARAAGLVGDQVGVRQPLRVLGPLDDHSAPPSFRRPLTVWPVDHCAPSSSVTVAKR